MFDLEEDPTDQVNLYGKEGYEGVEKDLKERLAALRSHYQVPEEDPPVPWYYGPLVRLLEWWFN